MTLLSTHLHQEIQQAVESAHDVCQTTGSTSSACAVAWDIVEELHAAVAHARSKGPQNSLEEFCNNNPDAVEARIYDI
ncbi:MAG: Calvin cycle protein CP12 [Thermosynechococcaceae cyanobacterium]